MSFGTTASKCHFCRTPFITGCVQKYVCRTCKEDGHDDAISCQKCEIDNQGRIMEGLLETIEELKEERRQKEHLLGLLRDSKIKHGACHPRNRKACTACSAQEELDKIVKEWKGFTIEVSNP